MANALASQVPAKFDLVLKDTGVMVAKGSYAKRTSSYAVPRFSTGEINYSDGSHWQAWAQTEWLGGQYQEFATDPARFLVSENVELEAGVVRPGKHAKVLADFANLGTYPDAANNVMIAQGGNLSGGVTYAIVNTVTSGVPTVNVYKISVSGKTMTATLQSMKKSDGTALSFAGTVCNAACIYQGFLALSLGSSDYPTTLTPANGNYGLCLFRLSTSNPTLYGTGPRILEMVSLPVSTYDLAPARTHLVNAGNQTLLFLVNRPIGGTVANRGDGNNPSGTGTSNAYGPRPVLYTFQLVNATGNESYVTYTMDPVPDGEVVTAMTATGQYVFIGTKSGKIYIAPTPATSTAATAQKQKSTFQLLYDAGKGSHVAAMKPYGNGIVFTVIETNQNMPVFEYRSDTVHYRVMHLYLENSAPIVKKLLDVTTKNPYVDSVDLVQRVTLTTYGDQVLCDGLRYGELLVNDGYGWHSMFSDDAVSYGYPVAAFAIGDVRAVIKRETSGGALNIIYEDNRYIYDNTPGGPLSDLVSIETSKFDAKLPSIPKIARRVMVKTRPLPNVNPMNFKLYYSVDGGAYTLLGQIDASFANTGLEQFTFDFPTGDSTIVFKTLQLKYVWDNGAVASTVDGIEVTDVVVDYVLAPDDSKEWSFKVLATNELQGNDAGTLFSRGKLLADAMWAAKEAKEIISFVDRDGVEYNVLVLDMTEYDPDMAAGKRTDELESFFQVRLLEVSRV